MKKVGKRTINKLLKEHFTKGEELVDRVIEVMDSEKNYQLKILTVVGSGVTLKPNSLVSGAIVWVNAYPGYILVAIRK